jgi:hypothetical protein
MMEEVQFAVIPSAARDLFFGRHDYYSPKLSFRTETAE